MMDNAEIKRLKKLLEDNFDFKTLKEIGFFAKDVRRSDYEIIAQRICTFFGYQSVYEFSAPQFIRIDKTVIAGKSNDSIDSSGKYNVGGGFLIGVNETEFTCPICEFSQDACENKAFNNRNYPVVVIKCKGCKRKLELSTSMGGRLTVTEKKATP